MLLNDIEPALFLKEFIVKDEYSAGIGLALDRDGGACVVVSLFDAAFGAPDNNAVVYLGPDYVDTGFKNEVVILIGILEHVHHGLESSGDVFFAVEIKQKRKAFHGGVSAHLPASYLGSQRSV